MMKTIKRTEENIERILKERAAAIQSIESQIKKDEEGLEAGKYELEGATKEGNLKKYREAKATISNYEDSLEMNRARLNTLKEKPLITQTYYEQEIAEIRKEFSSISEDAKKKLASLSEEMLEIALNLQNETNEANRVLRRFQHEIYRDADRSKNSDGKIVYFSQETKEVKAWEVVSWGKAAALTDGFKQYTGKKVE